MIRERSERFLQEGVEIHVGRKLVRRLEPQISNELRRVGRDRANAVGIAEGGEGGAVSEWVQKGAQARPVQSRRCAPVPVDVDDHRSLDLRELACGERGRGLMCALRENGVRPKVA